jgi:hypothetical protein
MTCIDITGRDVYKGYPQRYAKFQQLLIDSIHGATVIKTHCISKTIVNKSLWIIFVIHVFKTWNIVVMGGSCLLLLIGKICIIYGKIIYHGVRYPI